jgi:hypothetical protein
MQNLPNVGQDIFNVARLEAIGVLSAQIITAGILEYVSTGKLELPGIPSQVRDAIMQIIGDAETTVGEPIFDALLGASLGISDLGAAGSQEEAAVRTIKRALGFGVGLPIVAGAAEVPLKALLGPHLGTTIFEALRGISEEAGISFFLGFTLSNIFQTAVGQPITEAIARRTHPARFDFRIVKTLLKAHALTEAEALDQFDALGFRSQDAYQLLQLADAIPGIGELQQAYLFGLRDETFVRDQLARIGYDAAGVDLLVDVYLKRAETAGGDMLRTVAQKGYLEDHLSEAQYRAILASVNVPQPSIDLEIQAAALVKTWGRLQLTIAEVKALNLAGQIDDHASLSKLVANGYSQEDGQTIIDSWHKGAKAGRLGLGESKLLSYELGGLITRDEAYSRLVGLGYKADDAAFLADNPASFGGVFKYPLTPPAILAALKVGDIDDPTARTLLASVGMAPEEIDLRVRVAQTAGRRATKTKAAPKVLSEAQVLELLHYGLVDPSWALTELATLGYTDADAGTLVALELTKTSGQIPNGWVTLA